jgi:hypothetical protein
MSSAWDVIELAQAKADAEAVLDTLKKGKEKLLDEGWQNDGRWSDD